MKVEQSVDNPSDVEKHVRNFVIEYGDSISNLVTAPDIEITFTCALYADKAEGLFLEPDILEILAKTKSRLNYDLYV